MKLKSMILASAASLFAVNGAVAADAIVAVDPEPVDYVQICDAYGAGFFFIPGTEVCLDISGRVRVQYGYTNPAGPNNNRFEQDVDYRVQFDARHETDLGTVRSFIEIGDQGYVSQRGSFLESVQPNLVFIQIIGANGVTFTTGLAESLYDGESIMTALTFANGGFTGGIAYEDRNVAGLARNANLVGVANIGTNRLGGNDDAITANLGYSVDGFSVTGEIAYELGRAANGVNAPLSWNVGASYTGDRFGIALNYEAATGVSYARNFDFNNYEAIRFGRDELSIDLDLTLTDKLSASSDWDVLFNAQGWAVENTLAYAVSSNFSIEAEFDYVSDMGVDNRTNDRTWHLGLDFIATF
ncbi:MAG: porin [Pseudomonadota bacterium]